MTEKKSPDNLAPVQNSPKGRHVLRLRPRRIEFSLKQLGRATGRGRSVVDIDAGSGAPNQGNLEDLEDLDVVSVGTLRRHLESLGAKFELVALLRNGARIHLVNPEPEVVKSPAEPTTSRPTTISRHLESRTHNEALVDAFAAELATYAGCSARALRRDGLRADDFDGSALVDFSDGSSMTFSRAIVVEHRTKSLIGIFTEHCGYYAFSPVDVRVSRLWDGHVFHRYGDLIDHDFVRGGTLTIAGREYVAVSSAAYGALRGGDVQVDAIVHARLSLARSLRAARKHAGLTRRELAKRLRTSIKSICKSELGRIAVTVKYVKRLLKACGLPLDWSGPPTKRRRVVRA